MQWRLSCLSQPGLLHQEYYKVGDLNETHLLLTDWEGLDQGTDPVCGVVPGLCVTLVLHSCKEEQLCVSCLLCLCVFIGVDARASLHACTCGRQNITLLSTPHMPSSFFFFFFILSRFFHWPGIHWMDSTDWSAIPRDLPASTCPDRISNMNPRARLLLSSGDWTQFLVFSVETPIYYELHIVWEFPMQVLYLYHFPLSLPSDPLM